MKIFIAILFACCTACSAAAQKRVILVLPVVSVPNSSVGNMQLNMVKPDGIIFRMNQTFLCKGAYKTSKADTVTKAAGTISWSSGDLLEGHINTTGLNIMPGKGDLCYFLVDGREERKDVFYKIARYAISFTTVNDEEIFSSINSLGEWNEAKTKEILAKMAADVRYTGKAMLEEKNGQQQLIKGGDYDGRQLFDAMKEVKEADLLAFMQYVEASPTIYTGGTWRISETFATWMTSSTPKPTNKE